MTDRLTTLLHDGATGLDVPPAPVDAVIAGGRAIRRRRRTAVAAIGVAAGVAVVAAATAIVGASTGDRSPEPARPSDRQAYEQRGAWAQGDELHVGNHTVVVRALAQVSYTSVGVVARDGDGSFVLVTPAGEVETLDLDLLTGALGTPEVATDPGTSHLAYVRDAGSGRGQAVVRDLTTGEETEVGAAFPSDGPGRVDWLSGDLVAYERADDTTTADWRTGKPSADPQRGWWQAAGVSVNFSQKTWTLTTFDGDPLLSVPGDPASSYGSLSPDGRFFLVAGTEPGITVYDVTTGDSTVLAGRAPVNYGWTPDGHLVGAPAGGGSVETCDVTAGTCEKTGTVVSGALTLVAGTPGSAL